MSNYPAGMNWEAYDEYQDPMLECGHYASDSCDCWCPELFANRGHIVGKSVILITVNSIDAKTAMNQ